jgi:hypothetical protein
MPRSSRSGDSVAETRAWVADVVRSGLWSDDEVRVQVVDALRADHPGLPAERTAVEWIEAARHAWISDARTWAPVTDVDRLREAFSRLEAAGVPVLVGCADHWAAHDRLAAAPPEVRGIVWFTAPDVWHAIDEGMLEVNLWHRNTANAAPGDPLLAEVLAEFAAAGLDAHFDEGRIEVAAYWHHRP